MAEEGSSSSSGCESAGLARQVNTAPSRLTV